MKTAIGVCLVAFFTFYSFQSGPTKPAAPVLVQEKDIFPLDVGSVEDPYRLENLNPEVLLVNMIPREQGDEHSQDSEPFLAVNSDESLMVGAVFHGKLDPVNGAAPLFLLSNSKGVTWWPKSLLPGKQVGGQTYSFSGKGNSLYGSVLTVPDRNVSVFHTDDPASDNPLSNISTLSSGSQFGDAPFIQSNVAGPDAAAGEQDAHLDRIYVGQNFFGFPDPQKNGTASVRVSVDGKPFKLFGLEARPTGSVRQDGPAVRPAIGNDDVVYVAFMHWSAKEGNLFRGDLVVSRDDHAARGERAFRDLVDPRDALPGRIVAKDTLFSFYEKLGKQRVISPLALAVDPLHSEIVYVAWGDYEPATKTHVLHLRKSNDKGLNWSEDLRTISSAINPALAVTEQGVVGFLYQQLLPKTAEEEERWETQFLTSNSGGSSWTGIPLTRFPTRDEPEAESDPYLGYRTHLLAVNKNFYGIFSAPNKPDPKHFPQGVTFQRSSHRGNLTDGEDIVPTSVDPYFFRVAAPGPAFVMLTSDKPNRPQPGKFEALILNFGLPVALLGVFLLAGFTSFQLFRARRVSRIIDERIQGPTLTNYQGYVTAFLANAAGEPLDHIDPDSSLNLIVRFSHEPPATEFFEEINLQGGEDAREVIFVVEIDSMDFEVPEPHQMVSVPATGSLETKFKVLAPQASEGLSLFVQIFQKTRLVQVVAPRLGAAVAEY